MALKRSLELFLVIVITRDLSSNLRFLGKVRSLKRIGAGILANYRYYPNPDTNPVKLYASIGIEGYLQTVPFGFSSSEDLTKEESQKGNDKKFIYF
ncbi:hypothetical protein [Wolbachia endosymbiont of Mansonella ozzardi]|uniref:hypothetical protein n=1 Tax=Wolbachia endosymbiont of Mansonella ozzardi TaxID=137464 RepID=UPI001CE03B75|nr:hypothetical protein [Wolbachia endosymbiont of Mansonella ozzardi]